MSNFAGQMDRLRAQMAAAAAAAPLAPAAAAPPAEPMGLGQNDMISIRNRLIPIANQTIEQRLAAFRRGAGIPQAAAAPPRGPPPPPPPPPVMAKGGSIFSTGAKSHSFFK